MRRDRETAEEKAICDEMERFGGWCLIVICVGIALMLSWKLL